MNKINVVQHEKVSIENLIKENLYNSTAQAIVKLYVTRYAVLRVFLLIIVTCSTTMAAYMVINSILIYCQYKVVTKSRTIHEMPTLFPKVTFCNLNKYTTEYGFQTDDYGLTQEQRKSLGHSLNDILIDCSFNYEDCNASDFFWSFDEKYGNCYSFNAGFDSNGSKVSLKQSAFVGSTYGLRLKLYVNFYEKLLSLNSRRNGMGAVLRIENSSYWIDHGIDGVFVSAGFQTNVVVRREFKYNLPKPYSECEIEASSFESGSFNSNLYERISKSKYIYSRQCIYFIIFFYYFLYWQEKKYCFTLLYNSVYRAVSYHANTTGLGDLSKEGNLFLFDISFFFK